MISPYNFQHVEADILLNLGGRKYLVLGVPNGKPTIRLHDCGFTDNKGKYSRFVNFDFQQWCDFVSLSESVLPALMKLVDHTYAQNIDNVSLEEPESHYDSEVFRNKSPSTETKFHVGKNLHVVGKPPSKYLHVRRYFLSEENALDRSLNHVDFELTPTKQGVVLTLDEWKKLLYFIPLVQTIMFPEKSVETCFSKHIVQHTLINECPHCNPNGYVYWMLKREHEQNQKRKKNQHREEEEEGKLSVKYKSSSLSPPNKKRKLCSTTTTQDPCLMSINKNNTDNSGNSVTPTKSILSESSEKEDESTYWNSLKKKKGTKSRKRVNTLPSSKTETNVSPIVNQSTTSQLKEEQEEETQEQAEVYEEEEEQSK